MQSERGNVAIKIEGEEKYSNMGYLLHHGDTNTTHTLSLQGSTKKCEVLIETNLNKGSNALSLVAHCTLQ